MEFLTEYPITTALIAANFVASLIAFNTPEFNEQNLFRVGNVLKRGEWHRTVTSGFLHVNTVHLLMNMYVLFLFGPVLEDYFGTASYLVIYFGALIGGSAWMLWEKRANLSYSAVGASGAISGLILSYCLLTPFSEVEFFFIPMPAFVFGIGFIAISLFLSQRENAVIAHGGHLGGAFGGLILTALIDPQAVVSFVTAFGRA